MVLVAYFFSVTVMYMCTIYKSESEGFPSVSKCVWVSFTLVSTWLQDGADAAKNIIALLGRS